MKDYWAYLLDKKSLESGSYLQKEMFRKGKWESFRFRVKCITVINYLEEK